MIKKSKVDKSGDTMLIKEYRICMPITVEEVIICPNSFGLIFKINFQYKIGQLYMIAKHSHEQSQKGEGVEVIENRPHEVIYLLIYIWNKSVHKINF